MKKYNTSKKSLSLLKVYLFFVFLFLTILSRLYLYSYPIIMWTIILIFWSLFIVGAMIILPIYFAKTCYYVSPYEVSKQSGVFVESKQLMKVKSIQYITKIVTPLSKFTGFNFLKLNALGGSIVLMFLSKNDANDIASTIAAAIRQRDD